MSIKVTDNVGVTGINIRIYGPNGSIITQMFGYKISGTALAGSWGNDWAIPCTSAIGQYRVEVQALDAAGNATAWGSIPNFWVQASTKLDKAVPVVASGSVVPASVQVCKNINEMNARATDDVGVKTVAYKVVDASGVTRITETGYMKSGSKTDGTWSNDAVVGCSLPTGRYTVYAQATDEWQKISPWAALGTVDVVSAPVAAPSPTPTPIAAPVPAPAPVPTPTPVAAAMTITPYAVASSMRNASRSAVTSKTYSVKSTYYFASSLLFANGQNSGLLSIGNPLTLTSATPAICTIASVVSQDNTGGIFSLATINTLTPGSCNVVWQFAGASGRAATSKIMSFAVK
jgi:hypothetical protein